MSRKYEAVIVLDTKGKEDTVDTLVSQISKEFETHGARLTQVDNLGRKKFPTAPRHVEGGWYVNYQFETEPQSLDKIKSAFKLNENIYLQYFQRA